MDEFVVIFLLVATVWFTFRVLLATLRFVSRGLVGRYASHSERKAARRAKREQRWQELWSRAETDRNLRNEHRRQREEKRQLEKTERAAALRRKKQEQVLLRAYAGVRAMDDFGPLIAEVHLAQELSPEFRQRAFFDHRAALIDHAEACLRANMTRRGVRSEIEDLVFASAVNSRQVDYILGAAEARLAREPDFHSVLLDEIRLHKQRMASIQELHDDPEIIKQLLEIENLRHAEAVQRLSGVQTGGGPGVF